ncbi:MAG: GNAT family N-acetyltransferase [Methanomassiliicoccus sp.]|nr:GNAT family N-acetyltransferase [Methanomassiliicoccus sp.]
MFYTGRQHWAQGFLPKKAWSPKGVKSVSSDRSDPADLPLDIEVRAYLEGDETAIVPFLENVMGWPATSTTVDHLEHWRWKFLGNPLGFHLVCVALNGDSVISHSASMPVRMKVGDRTIIASQGVDLCTDPAFRGAGLIGRTMKCRNGMKDHHNVELDFGFPNWASYNLSVTKQGFKDLGIVMLQHRYIIDEEQFFKKVRFGSIKRLGYSSYQILRRSLGPRVDVGGGITLGQEGEMGSEFDELYLRASEDFDVMIVRDSAYLNWRYCDPRSGDFIVRTARHDGRLVGYMVMREESKDGSRFLNIVDCLADPRSPDVIPLLLMDCITLAKGMLIETVLCCLPEGHPYGKQMTEVGFLSQVRYTGDHEMKVIALERAGAGPLMASLTRKGLRAHIMLGDTDWV